MDNTKSRADLGDNRGIQSSPRHRFCEGKARGPKGNSVLCFGPCLLWASGLLGSQLSTADQPVRIPLAKKKKKLYAYGKNPLVSPNKFLLCSSTHQCLDHGKFGRGRQHPPRAPNISLSQLQRSCSGRPAKTCHAVQRRYRAGSGFDSADRSFISRREVTLCPDSTPIYRPPNSNTTETQQVAGEGKSSPLLSLQYSNGYVSPHLLPPRPRTS
jgi:hypothetical protein